MGRNRELTKYGEKDRDWEREGSRERGKEEEETVVLRPHCPITTDRDRVM